MKLPNFILEPLAQWLIGRLRAGKGAPHRFGDIVAADGSLYMERRWLIQPAWYTFGWGARIHRTARSDSDRHLHDHPWFNISVILRGWYYEEVPADHPDTSFFPAILDSNKESTSGRRRMPGDVVARRANDRHRLVIPGGGECFSLFIMGPWRQTWGFYTPHGKVPWRDYLGLPPKGADETY